MEHGNEKCQCHDCEQARWKSSLQGQTEAAMKPVGEQAREPEQKGTRVDFPEWIRAAADEILEKQEANYQLGFAFLRLTIAKHFDAAHCREAERVLCAARHSDGEGNDPQDCDWPFCGCDPRADKVVEALQECGWVSPKAAEASLRSAKARAYEKAADIIEANCPAADPDSSHASNGVRETVANLRARAKNLSVPGAPTANNISEP